MKKEAYILIIVVILLSGYILYDQLYLNYRVNLNVQTNVEQGNAPELVGISGFFNTDEFPSISELKGKVVLVDFWTYTCINCIRTLPHLVEWDKKYRDKGLVIIGVHTPEFEFEKKRENVENAIERYGIEYIVVQDNDNEIWDAYKNRFWPHKYLIDKNGNIVYDHIGEGGYEETERKIQELLGEEDMEISDMKDETPTQRITSELYAGYTFSLPRGQFLGNNGVVLGTTTNYSLPRDINSNVIYLEGEWSYNWDNLESKGDSSLFLKFTANDVNIVVNSLKETEMEVLINGKAVSKEQAGTDVEDSIVKVDEPRLYNLINGDYGNYLLELKVKEGFVFNAFTFG